MVRSPITNMHKPLLLALLMASASLSPAASPAPHGEILWDTYGVPHIFASNETGVFYGFGWAQAQSHGNVILRLYGEARGRAAEYWGAAYADGDRWASAAPARSQTAKSLEGFPRSTPSSATPES